MRVDLPAGPVEVTTIPGAPADAPRAALALAHGAGSGPEHPFLTGLTEALADAGIATLRFAFPYREAGRRMPGPAPHAIAAWSAAMAALGAAHPGIPLLAGGKSYGGRMASMAAADGVIAPDGLVYLGYPLHPPGKPDALRVAHLAAVTAPQLFVSGTRDPFVQPAAQLEAAVASCLRSRLEWVDGGNHSFEVAGRRVPADEIGARLAPTVVSWIEGVVA